MVSNKHLGGIFYEMQLTHQKTFQKESSLVTFPKKEPL